MDHNVLSLIIYFNYYCISCLNFYEISTYNYKFITYRKIHQCVNVIVYVQTLTTNKFYIKTKYIFVVKLLHEYHILLGRLPKVDLIILEGKNVRPSVRPQKVSSI